MKKWYLVGLVLLLAFFGLQGTVWSQAPVDAEGAVVEEEDILTIDEDVLESSGTLVSVDEKANSLVISDSGIESTFTVDPDAVVWLGEEEVSLADLKPGDKISLDFFEDEKGNLTTDWVEAERV